MIAGQYEKIPNMKNVDNSVAIIWSSTDNEEYGTDRRCGAS